MGRYAHPINHFSIFTIVQISLAGYFVCPWFWSDEGPITLSSSNHRDSHLSPSRLTADGGSACPVSYVTQVQLALVSLSLARYSVCPWFWSNEVPLILSSSNQRGSDCTLFLRCLRLTAGGGSSRPISYPCCNLLTTVKRIYSDGGHVFPRSSLL